MIGRALPFALTLGLLLAPSFTARAEAPDPETSPGFLYSGTWHLLIHYQDDGSADPSQWRWQDRIWRFASAQDGEELVWTEHLLVNFVDNTGRFTNLGTNLAARMPGAWEPSGRQRKQIENGLDITARATRNQRLLPSKASWQSGEGGAALARRYGSLYLSAWRIDNGKRGEALPIFEQRDFIYRDGEPEPLGHARFETRDFDPATRTLSGRFTRDGTRRGRFRMVPTHVASGGPVEPDEEGRIRIRPASGGRGGAARLLTFVMPWHYLGRRTLEVESTPEDATLDVAYVRRGSQLLYLEARAPVVFDLPPRFRTDANDVLHLRARAPGHQNQVAVVPVASRTERLVIDLEPVPNRLLAVRHRTLAGRASTDLVSKEPPVLRSRRGEGDLTLVLLDTAADAEAQAALAALRDPWLEGVDPLQAGRDLILVFRLSPEARRAGLEIRDMARADPVRGVHISRLDWSVPEDRGKWVDRVSRAIHELDPQATRGCRAVYDQTLRQILDPAVLLAAPADAPPFMVPVYRAAIRRLGALSKDGVLQLADGTRLDPRIPLELELALQRLDQVEGYVAVLRALTQKLEPAESRASAFAGLVAPTISPEDLDAFQRDALAAEASCERAGEGEPGDPRPHGR